jgi:hypothetical protein
VILPLATLLLAVAAEHRMEPWRRRILGGIPEILELLASLEPELTEFGIGHVNQSGPAPQSLLGKLEDAHDGADELRWDSLTDPTRAPLTVRILLDKANARLQSAIHALKQPKGTGRTDWPHDEVSIARAELRQVRDIAIDVRGYALLGQEDLRVLSRTVRATTANARIAPGDEVFLAISVAHLIQEVAEDFEEEEDPRERQHVLLSSEALHLVGRALEFEAEQIRLALAAHPAPDLAKGLAHFEALVVETKRALGASP